MSGIIKYWLPVFLWASLIFTMSSVPGEEIPPLFPYQDIFYHITIYLILAWLLRRALRYSFMDMSLLRQIYTTVIVGLVYALTDEYHQSFVPQRDVSVVDLSMDSIGLLIGSLIYRWQR